MKQFTSRLIEHGKGGQDRKCNVKRRVQIVGVIYFVQK